MPKEKNNNIYILKKKIRETDNTVTLRFLPAKGKIIFFKPGQFIIIYFMDNRRDGQGKPYSISNIPSDNFLNITIKKIGKFSGALHNLKIGEKIKISDAQGYFYPEDEMKDVIFLAGGIGITPFYSIINTYFRQGINDKNLTLFYSNKTETDSVFLKELNNLTIKYPKLKVIYLLTQQKNKPSFGGKIEFQRLDIKILKKHLENLNNKHYFICGSIGFVNDLWKCLKDNKVKEDNIKVESFY